MAGRTPDALINDESVESFSYSALGNYLRRREYYVKDQYDWVWGFVDSVDEYFEEDGENSCNLSVYTGATETNSVGRFEDKYGNANNVPNPIPACAINPNCRSEFRQFVTVGGVPFDHSVVYDCNNVQIGR